MAQLSPPQALNLYGNITENWRRWKQCFKILPLASGLSEKEVGVQASMFLHVAGPEALQVYNTLMAKPNNKNKVDEKFDQYCNPHKKSHVGKTQV